MLAIAVLGLRSFSGKSTLLNGLLGEAKFEAGKSYGVGLTKVLQLAHVGGHWYGDTPGLDDIAAREKAAKEIEQVLKKDGRYRLVFVCTLSSGRCMSADATTIKLVLESVKVNVPFGIIFNKLAQEEMEDLCAPTNDPENPLNDNIKAVLTGTLSGTKRTTHHFLLLQNIRSLAGKDNVVPPQEVVDNLRHFLDRMPYLSIETEDVKPIDVSTIDQVRDKLGKDIDALKKDKVLLEKTHQEQLKAAKEAHAEQLAEFKRHTDKQLQELEDARKAAEKHHAEQMQLFKDDAKRSAEEVERQRQRMDQMQKEMVALASRK